MKTPKTQNQRLEVTGRAKPGKTSGLAGKGPGVPRQGAACHDFGRVKEQSDQVLWSEPGPLAGHLNQLLTLTIYIDRHRLLIVTTSNLIPDFQHSPYRIG